MFLGFKKHLSQISVNFSQILYLPLFTKIYERNNHLFYFKTLAVLTVPSLRVVTTMFTPSTGAATC